MVLEGGIGSLILGERAVLYEFSASGMLTEDLEARNMLWRVGRGCILTNVRASRSVQNSCIWLGERGDLEVGIGSLREPLI